MVHLVGARTAGGFLARNTFLWGVAGAGHQIEGGNVASDIWLMEHTQPTAFREPSGDAADSYHRFEEDIALTASLGFNAYRLSIEWSRIEPERGLISTAALIYYRRVLEAVARAGLQANVTFNHFTVPRWFAAGGGFERREGVEPFVAFCRTATEHLGDIFDLASTFNEPNLVALLQWGPQAARIRALFATQQAAAAQASGAPDWRSPVLGSFRVQQPIMVEAHNRAYEAVKKASGGRIEVGVTLAMNDERSAPGESAYERKLSELYLPWFAAQGDYIGVQNYTYAVVGPDADLPPDEGVELTQMNYPFAPEALAGAVRLTASRCRKPIYVTENGVATEDDTRRVAFIDGAIAGLRACIEDGIDVRGYFHWSLLDNWEWFHGYGPKFGLVSWDPKTFARTPKPSAVHLGQIAKADLQRRAKA